MALVQCYKWEKCVDPSIFIWVSTGYSNPDSVVYYNGDCYLIRPSVVSLQNEVVISGGTFYDKCSSCLTANPTPTPTTTQTLTAADEMNKVLFDSMKNDNDLTGDTDNESN